MTMAPPMPNGPGPRDDDWNADEPTALPSFQAGGRVERTGIALVHEGEYIVPAPGSEAVIATGGSTEQVINYYFPIEIEVMGTLNDAQVQRVAQYVFDELESAFRSRS
jgi:hypothetical protein